MYICIYICIYVCTYVYMCMYTYTCVCICICIVSFYMCKDDTHNREVYSTADLLQGSLEWFKTEFGSGALARGSLSSGVPRSPFARWLPLRLAAAVQARLAWWKWTTIPTT